MRGLQPRLPDWLSRLGKLAVGLLVVLYFIFAALVLSLRYAILPNIDSYREDIVQLASQTLGLKIDVVDIDAAWSGLRPQLVLKEIVVYDRNQRAALRLPRVTATLSWGSLLSLQLHLHSLEIEQPDLDIRRDAQGQLYVAGLAITAKPGDDQLAEWVLAQDAIFIRDARVRWNDELRHAPELTLSNIQFVLSKTRLRHDFTLTASTPEILTSATEPVLAVSEETAPLVQSSTHSSTALSTLTPLNLRGHFEKPLFSRRWSDQSNWSGEIYTEFSDIELAGWHPWIDYPVEISRGRGALRAWLDFSGEEIINDRATRLPELTVDLLLQQVSTRLRKDLPVLGLDQVKGRISLRQMATGEELMLHQFSLKEANGLVLAPTDLTAQHVLAQGKTPEQGSLQTSQLDLETLASVTERLPLSADIRKLLADYQPRGVLRDLNFKWQGALQDLQHFDLSSQFKGLAIAPHASTGAERPGFENLNGQIKASQSGGTLTLGQNSSQSSTQDLNQNNGVGVNNAPIKLNFPGIFAEPEMSFDKLAGRVTWKRDGDGKGDKLEVNVTQLVFENVDVAGHLDATYRHDAAAAGLGDLDLSGQLSRAAAARIFRYLPLGIHVDTRNYLQAGLLSGRAEEMDFKVLGPLDEFPFNENRMALNKDKTASGKANVTAAVAATTSALAKATRIDKLIGNTASKTPVFRIAGKIRHVDFNYAPDLPAVLLNPKSPPPWPIIEDVNGELLIDRQRIVIKADTARVYGVKLEQVKADLPDMEAHEPQLEVTGSGTGPLIDLVRFTNASPINGWINRFTADTRASGTAKLALKLNLPLAKIENSKVSGSITFQNNEVVLLPELPLMQRVNGRLDFSESGIGLRAITGQFLGGPMRLEGNTKNGLIEIRGEGQANLAALANLRDGLGNSTFAPRLADRLGGSTRFNVALNLYLHPPTVSNLTGTSTAATPPMLLVESSLAGLSINLPEPFKKAASESWPLRVELAARPGNAGEQEELRIRLGTLFNALFERRRVSNGSGSTATSEMRITRAAYGINQPATLNDTTAYANINLKALDVDVWMETLRQLNASNTPASAPAASNSFNTSLSNYFPEMFAIRAADLRLYGKNYANVSAAGSHIKAGNGDPVWQANIDADQVSGYLTWRQGARQDLLTARLARLKIPQSDTTEASVSNLIDAGPKDMPALDIIADAFELSGKKWGRLELQATNSIPNASNFNRREWQLQKLNISNEDASFEAKGVWGPELALNGAATGGPNGGVNGPPLRTRLSFTVKAVNVGKLMDRFGSKDTVRNGTALLEGEVGWRGSPLAIDYPTLSGRMRLEADKGQFLKADPGIAKLLGVLSLQSLPRRLTLDFRDVFSEGFAFDEIRANVNVENGSASTKDFKMRGVAATVLIEGSTDLARETQRLHVLVLPEIGAGAAALGYAALANPAIGLGAFLAQYVLRDPLSRAFSHEYNILGSWANPNIEKTESKAPAVSMPTQVPTPTITPDTTTKLTTP